MKNDLFLFQPNGCVTPITDPPVKYTLINLNPDFFVTKTLLVVEDEDINYLLIVFILSKLGINILRAKNGAVAVSICQSEQPVDIVLMDIRMPVMDGYEATEKIKKIRPNLPVIIQTAHTTTEDIAKAFACGCSDFLAKPFKKIQVVEKITKHLLKHC